MHHCRYMCVHVCVGGCYPIRIRHSGTWTTLLFWQTFKHDASPGTTLLFIWARHWHYNYKHWTLCSPVTRVKILLLHLGAHSEPSLLPSLLNKVHSKAAAPPAAFLSLETHSMPYIINPPTPPPPQKSWILDMFSSLDSRKWLVARTRAQVRVMCWH